MNASGKVLLHGSETLLDRRAKPPGLLLPRHQPSWAKGQLGMAQAKAVKAGGRERGQCASLASSQEPDRKPLPRQLGSAPKEGYFIFCLP